jgi:hypothetical protein
MENSCELFGPVRGIVANSVSSRGGGYVFCFIIYKESPCSCRGSSGAQCTLYGDRLVKGEGTDRNRVDWIKLAESTFLVDCAFVNTVL